MVWVRLAAALMVLVGHEQFMNGYQPRIGIQHVGLFVFFIISGFLIAQSWTRDPDPVRFAQRRTLRLLPGLVPALAFTLALAPPYRGDALEWFVIANASLWSIPVEAACYAVVALMGSLGMLRPLAILAVVPAAFLLPDTIAAVCVCFAAGAFTFSILGPHGRPSAAPDISYGVYLYAWPVQVVALQHIPGFGAQIAVATAAACILGALSWRFVEAPALRLKPGHGSTRTLNSDPVGVPEAAATTLTVTVPADDTYPSHTNPSPG